MAYPRLQIIMKAIIMAFITNVADLQAFSDTDTGTDKWEMLTETILIPEDWIAMALQDS